MTIERGPFLTALEQVLGHGAPFADQELHQLRQLSVQGATDLSPLSSFPRLAQLTLLACADQGFEAIERLHELTTLSIVAVPLRSLAPLAKLHDLQRLELFFTQVEDLSPLLGAPGLKTLHIDGSPLTKAAFESGVTQLEERGVTVHKPNPSFWALCRQLHEAGTGTVFGQYGGPPLLVRPGVPQRPGADSDFIDKLHPGIIRMKVGGLGANAGALFDTLLNEEQARRELPTRLVRHDYIEQGSAAAAAAWVSRLPEHRAAPLKALLQRFPRQTFQRFRPSAIALRESRHGVRFPRWLHETLEAFAGFAHQGTTLVQLAGSSSSGAPAQPGAPGWYTLELLGADNETEQAVIDHHHLFPIAKLQPVGGSTLAIKLDGASDEQVYEFDERLADHRTGLSRAPRVVFDSFAALWGEIRAIQLPDGTVVQGTEP
jgi:hypothetical protein